MIAQQMSRIGQMHAAPDAPKQMAAQFIFQLFDVLADGGLRQIQGLTRLRKAARTDGGIKNFELMKIHFVALITNRENRLMLSEL